MHVSSPHEQVDGYDTSPDELRLGLPSDRGSNGPLGDREALRPRLEEDGYFYFSSLLDREKVLCLRRKMLVGADNHDDVAAFLAHQ